MVVKKGVCTGPKASLIAQEILTPIDICDYDNYTCNCTVNLSSPTYFISHLEKRILESKCFLLDDFVSLVASDACSTSSGSTMDGCRERTAWMKLLVSYRNES